MTDRPVIDPNDPTPLDTAFEDFIDNVFQGSYLEPASKNHLRNFFFAGGTVLLNAVSQRNRKLAMAVQAELDQHFEEVVEINRAMQMKARQSTTTH